jgi:hypothetical protein
MARCRRGGGTKTSWHPFANVRSGQQGRSGLRFCSRRRIPRWHGAAESAAPCSVFVLCERSVEECGGGRVHQFAALDVVHHRDPGVGVAEQFCSEFDAGVGVDRGRNGSAEHVGGYSVDARSLEHLAKLSAHVRGGQRRAVPGLEQQVIQAHAPDFGEPPADCVGGEGGDGDNAGGLGGFGVVLPEGLLPLAADDGAGQADRRHGAGDIDVPAAYGEDLADPG